MHGRIAREARSSVLSTAGLRRGSRRALGGVAVAAVTLVQFRVQGRFVFYR